jgi:hypothetical protein
MWHATGGNPGGYITAHFYSGTGYASFGSGTSWTPGNALGDYGGKLQVDLASFPLDTAVIGFHTNNSSVWPCQDVGSLGAGWATVSITLDLNDLRDCNTAFGIPGKSLTPAQASAALAGFASMFVHVINHDVGAYNVSLDNASLSGPQSPVTAPTGTLVRQLRMSTNALSNGGREVWGTLMAPDDYSCAGKMKVTIFRRADATVKVATAITSAQVGDAASFSVTVRNIRHAFYYASVVSSESPLDGNTCYVTRSKGVWVPY